MQPRLGQVAYVTTTRRQFLGRTAGLLVAPAVLGGCGFVPANGERDDRNTLTFTTWGTDSELAGFRSAIAAFEKANPGKSVALNAVPYDQMFPNLDAQIQGGYAPDIFRVPYYTLGTYAGRGQLLKLSPYLDADAAAQFTRPAWAAVQSDGHPVGLPHHTDTSVILYNKDLLSKAGVPTPPSRVDEAWTWNQFAAVARTLQSKLPDGTYPFVVNWQGNGVTRWLNWLFQDDGRFLDQRLDAPAISSTAGRRAIDFTASFFTRKLVPPDTSVTSATLAQDIWFSQTAAMTFAGAFLLPSADTGATFDWGATYAPRRDRAGSDFGGNALVATAGTTKPTLAARFLEFMTGRERMRDFCVGASLLPTRRDLIDGGIEFDVRPKLSHVFLDQARTVRAQDAAQVASPSMQKIITVLQDQLEDAFVGGQSTSDTLDGLTAGIRTALAG